MDSTKLICCCVVMTAGRMVDAVVVVGMMHYGFSCFLAQSLVSCDTM